MKRIIIALLVLFAFFTSIFAQESEDTNSQTDTTEVIQWEDTQDDNSSGGTVGFFNNDDPFDFNFGTSSITLISIIAIIMVFGFPLFIVFIAFYFQYKSRKAKYKLAEQALASGQPIPENVIKESINDNTQSKGIKNVFTGIGLFIFLWAITSSFALGTIGLLVMFTGFGQLVVSYINKNKEDK